MKQKLIALTGRNQSEKSDNPIVSDNLSYFEYVQSAGAIPVIVQVRNEEEACLIAEKFDGLLITGGEDCIPGSYGEDNTGSFPIEPEIEKSDFLLYYAFKKNKKPVLGICRGIQVIGVCEGVKLIQDIPSVFYVEHAQSKMNPPIPRNTYCHRVSITKESRLFSILGEECSVNSFHHQALQSVPAGFLCGAKSNEGIIESVECENILGVQWHPERLILDDRQHEIIQKWIENC